MSVITFPAPSNKFLSLRNALRKMECSLEAQSTAARQFKKSVSALREEMRLMAGSMKDFDAALSRINIRSVGMKSRALVRIVNQ